MTDKPGTNADQPLVYQFKMNGYLDDQWSDWFDGLTITHEENGETILTGPVIDQPALHGILKKVRDLGIPLISVNRVESDQSGSGRQNVDVSNLCDCEEK